MYEKNGEKYFIVDSHMHLLERRPGQLGARRRAVRQGLDRVLPRLPGPRAAGDALVDRALPEVLRGRPDEGRLRGRPRRRGDLPADVPEGVVHGGLQHHRAATRRMGEEAPRQVHLQHPLRPARRRRRPASSSRRNVERYGSKGVKLYTAEWNNGSRGWKLTDPGGVPLPGEVRRSSASRTSTSTRARRSGRWTRTPSTSPTSTTRRPTSRSSTSSSSTSACRGSRTSASWRRRSPTSTRACPWSSAA